MHVELKERGRCNLLLFGKTTGHQPPRFGKWGSPPSHVWHGGERGEAMPLLIWTKTLLWGAKSWHPNYLTCIPKAPLVHA